MSVPARVMKKDKYGFTADENLIRLYRNDTVLAARDILGIRLNWFQRIMMRDFFLYAFILELLGRGCSKTSCTTMYLVLKAILYPGQRIGCLAPSYRQSQFVFDEMKNLEPNSPFFRASLDKNGISVGTMRAIARFKNGSFIEALPIADGSTIRGRRYSTVFIDEYADVPEDIVNRVILPFLNVIRGNQENQLIIASTARYKWNHFWSEYVKHKAKEGTLAKDAMDYLIAHGFKPEPLKYRVFEYDFRDVNIEEDAPFRMSDSIINRSYSSMTLEEFGMENLNLFPNETIGFFPAKLVLDFATSNEEDHQFLVSADDQDSFYFFGVDVARSDNPLAANFCIQVVRVKQNQRNLCKTITLHGATYQEMVATLRQAHIDFGLERVLRIDMDAAGGGSTLRDLLLENWKHPFTGKTYEPIVDETDENFQHIRTPYKSLRLQNQTDVFNNYIFHSLKADLEKKRLVLPITIRKDFDKTREQIGLEIGLTKTELILLEASASKAGFKFEVPKGYQKDRAVALALCNHAINSFYGEAEEIKPPPLGVGFWVR